MSSSPFAPFANSMLTFSVLSTTSTIDPVTGNHIFSDGDLLVISAKLRENSRAVVQRLPGVHPSAIYLEGNAVSPMQVSDRIKPESRGSAVWGKYAGSFVILFAGQSPYGTEKILGDRISGWFEFQ